MFRTLTFRWISTVVAVVVLSMSTGGSSASARGDGGSRGAGTSPPAGAASPPQCRKTQLHVTARTDHDVYPPGRSVTMTSSIKNVSSSSCSIFLGAVPGWSPTFTVTDARGSVVADRCWVDDRPGACATVLRSYTLRAGHRFGATAIWDQRSGPDGQTPVQVPQGQYTFTTRYRDIEVTASVTFDILIG